MKQQDQIVRQGDVKITSKEAEVRRNAVNNKHKFGETLKKKQTQELNTMRFAAGQRNSINIYATRQIEIGDMKGFKPSIEEYSQQADFEKKNNPVYNGLPFEQQMEAVYGNILSNGYSYGTPHSDENGYGELDKRMVIL